MGVLGTNQTFQALFLEILLLKLAGGGKDYPERATDCHRIQSLVKTIQRLGSSMTELFDQNLDAMSNRICEFQDKVLRIYKRQSVTARLIQVDFIKIPAE